MEDQKRDRPYYLQNRLTNLSVFGYVAAGLSLSGNIYMLGLVLGRYDYTGQAGILAAIVAIAFAAILFSDFLFCPIKHAWYFPMLMGIATAALVGGFLANNYIGAIAIALGMAIQLVLWVNFFMATNDAGARAGISLIFIAIGIIVLTITAFLEASVLPWLACVFVCGGFILYATSPSNELGNARLLQITRKVSAEHLPTHRDLSKMRFGFLRGTLLAFSVYSLFLTLAKVDTPRMTLISILAGTCCLLITAASVLGFALSHQERGIRKQVELFHRALPFIAALLLLLLGLQGLYLQQFVYWILLCLLLERGIFDIEFCCNWANVYNASPFVSLSNSLSASCVGSIVGCLMAGFVFEIPVVTIADQPVSLLLVAVFILSVGAIYVTGTETAKRYDYALQEIDMLLGEFEGPSSNYDANARKAENAPSGDDEGQFEELGQMNQQKTGGFSSNGEKCRAYIHYLGLTMRQAEVLVYLLQGRTAAYISDQLVVSMATTRTHIQNVYKRAGVHSHRELIEAFDEFSADQLVDESL